MNDEQKRAIRQAYKEQEASKRWNAIVMDRTQLNRLYEFIEKGLAASGCKHNLSLTRQWVADAGLPMDLVLNGLQDLGGYCDCEVLANTDPDQTL